MMMGLSLAIPALAARGQGQWWRGIYDVESISGGTISPGLIADLKRRRFALPMGLTPAQILAAAPVEIAAAMRICDVSDIFELTRASATTALINGVLTVIDANRFAFGDQGLGLFGGETNYVKRSSHTTGFPWSSSAHNGITATIVGTGNTGGVPYADFLLTGTNGAVWTEPFVDVTSSITSDFAVGDPFCASLYGQLISGSWPSGVVLSVGVQEEFASHETVGGSGQAALSSVPQRITFSRQISSPAAAFVRSSIGLEGLGEPGTTTFTGQIIRLYGWQLEKSYVASPLIQTLNGDIATRAADNCKLTPRARALMARTGCGLVAQGLAMNGSSGRIVGGVTSRVAGFNIAQDKIVLGSGNVIDIGMTTIPTPAFGLAAGWDGGGKAGSYQSAAVTTSASPLDADLSDIYLGRDSGGTYANGYFQGLLVYPARPANEALPGKATPHV